MEAIDHLSKNNFNVVLLDLLMPKKSGHDVLDYIKNQILTLMLLYLVDAQILRGQFHC